MGSLEGFYMYMQCRMFIRLNKNSDISFRVKIREHVSLTVNGRKPDKAASNVISICRYSTRYISKQFLHVRVGANRSPLIRTMLFIH